MVCGVYIRDYIVFGLHLTEKSGHSCGRNKAVIYCFPDSILLVVYS